MKEKVKQQPFRSSYDNLIRYNGLNAMFRPVPNDALYFLVNKNSIDDFFSMMKYSLYATKQEKLISDLNEAFVENNPCFGNSITKFRSKNLYQKLKSKCYSYKSGIFADGNALKKYPF